MRRQIPKLHLYHIPRTGGMSIGHHMRRHNVVDGVKHIAYHISGHAHYRAMNKTYFTMMGIRDPVDHMASLYKYIRGSRAHGQHAVVSKMTFGQYIKFSRDSYLAFLTTKRKRTVENAINNLSKISFVYLTPHLDDDMGIFFKYMCTGMRWHNTRFNGTPPMEITKAEVREVRQKRAPDVEIFEAAKRLNAAQCRFFRKHSRSGLLPDLDWSGVIV